MFLNKLPAVKTPPPVIFGAALLAAAFYFWYTQPAQSGVKPISERRQPEI